MKSRDIMVKLASERKHCVYSVWWSKPPAKLCFLSIRRLFAKGGKKKLLFPAIIFTKDVKLKTGDSWTFVFYGNQFYTLLKTLHLRFRNLIRPGWNI